MTFKEKLLAEHPEKVNEKYMGGCFGCPIDYKYEENDPVMCDATIESCIKCWDRTIPDTEPTELKEDVVNHPNHYTNCGMECIDEMILIFGKEAVAHFCLCNAWKYRYRSLYKNGEEDMKKSHWYINKYKELVEEWKNDSKSSKSGM